MCCGVGDEFSFVVESGVWVIVFKGGGVGGEIFLFVCEEG